MFVQCDLQKLGSVKGYIKKKIKLNWKIALKFIPMKTISLLCLYNDFLFFSSVAVIELFHFLHKCQQSGEKAISYECW